MIETPQVKAANKKIRKHKTAKAIFETLAILAIIAAFMLFFAFMCYQTVNDNPKPDPNREIQIDGEFETILE